MNEDHKPLQFLVEERSEHMGLALGQGIAALIQLELVSDKYEDRLMGHCKNGAEITQMFKFIEASIQATNTTFNSLLSGYVALVAGNIVDCDVTRAAVEKVHKLLDLEISTLLKDKPQLLETAKKRSKHYFEAADLILSKSFDMFAFPDLKTNINITLGAKA